MALLNRNQDEAKVPEEIQEYYQSEQRERTGVAWLLAIGTLLVTVVLAAGIFFSGRWAYRNILDNDGSKSPPTAQQQGQKDEVAQNSGGQSNGQTRQSQTPPPAAPSPTPTPPPPAATPAPPPSRNPQPTPTPAAQPVTGEVAAASTPLPSTGPSGLLGVFVSVTLAGYLVHRFGLSPRKLVK